MSNALNIERLHLELSSNCNASCGLCGRTESDGTTNKHLPIKEINLTDIKNFFPSYFIKNLKQIVLCGNYGDPTVARDCLEICMYFKELNPRAHIRLITNGSTRTQSWWKSLASVVDICHFSIDGLEETNSIYRRGTNFNKIMKNMSTFINAGGYARWDFIVFRHNEFQVELAKKLSNKMNVQEFVVKKTGRFFDTTKQKVKDSYSLQYKNEGYKLQMPIQEKYKTNALRESRNIINKFGSISNYLKQTPINCKSTQNKEVYISSEGLVFPCCWTAGQLYQWHKKAGQSQIFQVIQRLPDKKKEISLHHRSIENILRGEFLNKKIPMAWAPQFQNRLKVCARMCGNKLNQFDKQFIKNSNEKISSSR